MNLFLGVVLLCHPFILRLSSVTQLEGYNLYARILTNGQFTRFGKDSFFLLMAPVLLLVGKELRELPRTESLAILSLVFISFINQNDFLLPTAFYQFIMISAGASITISLYKKVNQNSRNVFLNLLYLQSWSFSIWIILEKLFQVKPYTIYLNSIYENILVKSTHDLSHVAGPLGHPNLSGAFLALAIPALLYKRAWGALSLSLFSIYFCSSALPVVTAIGVISYYLYARFTNMSKLLPFLLATIFGITIYFTGIDGLDNQRFGLWRTALDRLDFNWIYGGGTGFFGDSSLKGQYINHKLLHNEFLAVFTSYGFIGLGIGALLLKRALRACSPVMASGLFGVFINSYGNFPFHVSFLAMVAICYYVFCLKESNEVLNV